jgi:hypothetical protein
VSLSPQTEALIRRRNRRRFTCALIVLSFYLAFLLQYIGLVSFFAGGSGLRSPAYFCLLIVGFLGLEWLYLRARRREDTDDDQAVLRGDLH